MKQTKLKIKAICVLSITSYSVLSQTPTGVPPTPYPAFSLPEVRNLANNAWFRGGNTNNLNNNNIFGTMWNSPIYTHTDGQNRMVVNGTKIGTINGYTGQNTSGFVGIGANTAAQGFLWNTPSVGPMSLLHLNSGIGASPQIFGWRPWMKYGIVSTHNQDFMFMGQRQNGTGFDVTDAVINWSDNSGNGSGPDNMIFCFTEGDGQGGNDLLGSTLNGREIMRMTGYGNVGISPRLNNANQPQSTLHQHQENAASSWMQITNQYLTTATPNQTGPTSITANNGLRWGIIGNNIKNKNGHAYMYNQENRHLIFSTNHGTPNDAQFTSERVRITNISAPTDVNNNFVTWNPAGFVNQDVTRVSISHNPATPVTRPMSLLHLGYNTGGALTPTNTDGWRRWMDVGAFIAQGTDNAYFGLKPETGANNDRQDAVIGWGDNYLPNNLLGQTTGIDKLRIIFTTPLSGQLASGPGDMGTQNGLEFVRYVPFHNASLNVNDPRTGFGNFEGLLPIGAQNPNNTVEINSIMDGFNAPFNSSVTGSYPLSTGASGLRFRDLTSKSLVVRNTTAIDTTKFLTVDSLGNVVLVRGSGGGVYERFGAPCGSSTSANLPTDWLIGMSGHNVNFNGTGNVQIGDIQGCSNYQYARLWVRNSVNGLNPTTGLRVDNMSVIGAYAGYFDWDVGVNGFTSGNGYLVASDENIKRNRDQIYKSMDIIKQLNPVSYLYDNSYAPQLNLNSHKNYGFIAQEVAEILPDLVEQKTILATYDSLGNEIYPSKTIKTLNYDGIIPIVVSAVQELNTNFERAGLSDAQVKTDVANFNALAKIKTLNPVSYHFTNANVPQLSFGTATDYGFVAQEIETVYPELIDTVRIAETLDTLGNVANPAKTLKTVNYKAMNALLTRAIQEQQVTIDSLKTKASKQDSINNAVQNQLANLTALLNQCCQNPNTSARLGNQQSSIENQLSIELSDKDVIVLTQNVPNPFAEQTTIAYNVPISVAKAQIIFYNAMGQIIETVDIKTRGKGKVNVFASDLSSGLYHYTLVADGKVMDSKKMVRQ